MRAILATLTMCLFVLPAQAKYSGGTGEPNDPYQIATAADLIALGETPGDYDKHFILTADIDLDPNLPGCRVFDKAVIAPDTNDATWEFEGTAFTAVFEGNGHTISHLTMAGGGHLGLFGASVSGATVKDLGLVAVHTTGTGPYVGGLVGYNSGAVTQCYSTGTVRGQAAVGGLVGYNYAAVTRCWGRGAVSGRGEYVGGLVGENYGIVTQCYSTGAVSGDREVGGLVGGGSAKNVTSCFWDIRTSGQTTNAGGIGKTTAEMQTARTFLDAGWDCVDEVENGTEDIWWIDEGKDYPHLWWELREEAQANP